MTADVASLDNEHVTSTSETKSQHAPAAFRYPRASDRYPLQPRSVNATSHTSTTAGTSSKTPSAPPSSRASFPFSLPPKLFTHGNPSSISIASSTAEGKPIPVDDTVAAHRTSALRQLNSDFPSAVTRHGYTKSTSAQNSTHSQPVIVRTYTRPQTHSRSRSTITRQPIGIHQTDRRSAASRPRSIAVATIASVITAATPSRWTSSVTDALRGSTSANMAGGKTKKKASPWPWQQPQETNLTDRLPPVEAYTFKGLMENLGEDREDIDKAIDGIAQIYARSRYSLSNQYEVHVQPHGSGASFISGPPSTTVEYGRRHRRHGRSRRHYQPGSGNGSGSDGESLTLQAVQSDEDTANSRRARHSGANRRRSAAHTKLETIMSSSRSSEEEKKKKKGAEQLKEEVRGRVVAARAEQDKAANAQEPLSDTTNDNPEGNDTDLASGTEYTHSRRRKSTSFASAMLHAESSHRQRPQPLEDGDHGPALVTGQAAYPRFMGMPALPQASDSHLEIRTRPLQDPVIFDDTGQYGLEDEHHADLLHEVSQTAANLGIVQDEHAGFLDVLTAWAPWRSHQNSRTNGQASVAEGSLRELLRHTEGNV